MEIDIAMNITNINKGTAMHDKYFQNLMLNNAERFKRHYKQTLYEKIWMIRLIQKQKKLNGLPVHGRTLEQKTFCLNFTLVIKHDVLRFQVSVNNSIGVKVTKSQYDLS